MSSRYRPPHATMHIDAMYSSKYLEFSVHPQPGLTRYFPNNVMLDTWGVMRRAAIDKLVIYIVCPLQVSRLSMASTYNDERYCGINQTSESHL